MDNYQVLIEKLDAFIRKYYRNQLLRGGIYAFTLGLAFYLVVTTLEYFGHFSTGLRTALFYGFVAGIGFILVRFVAIPLSHLYRIGKIISHEQAAKIIGDHFREVQDKLLNVLQLKKLSEESLRAERSNPSNPGMASSGTPRHDSIGLLTASIEQKSEVLKPVPFVSAVNLSENRKYLRYAAVPFFLLIIVLFTAPSLIKDSTKRLIEHGTYFEKPAPFTFEILNKELKTVQQQDYTLDVKVTGKEAPQEAYIEIDGNQFKLEKENLLNFHYTFKNIQKTTDFRLFADGFYSHEYTLEAVPNPVLMNFEITLNYPPYLNKQNEKLQNTGDLLIPAGTKVSWLFHTRNTDTLQLAFEDATVAPVQSGTNEFSFNKKFLRNDSYTVKAANKFMQNKDSVRYSVSVIPDLYPSITVEQQRDSLSSKRIYFKGLVKDDYGFTKLSFNYHFLKAGYVDEQGQSNQGRQLTELLPVNKNTTSDQFFYFWDVSNLNVLAGDEIEYYFEVYDNDGVNGPKATRSQTQMFKAPTLNEIAENTSKNNENVKSDLKESIAQAKQLEKEANELQNKLLDKKEMSWEDKKKAADLLAKQKELEQKLEALKNKNEQNNEQKSEYKQMDQNLLDKQKQLQDLMAKMMTPELQKMLEQMQKMMDQVDKNQLQDQLKQMKLDNKDLEKEMERALELFKQMEFEQKLQDNIDKLNDLAKKQDSLSKESDQKTADSKDLKDKQDSLNKNFEDLKKDMADLEKKNDALEQKNNLPDTKEDQQDIQQDQKESSDQLSQGKSSKASKSQKKASDKMQKLADKLSKAQQDMEAQQDEEDENALRALLENLLRLSFDQEKLMTDLKTMDINNPQYLKASQEQRRLKDNSKMVEDSLFALSKRVVQIQSKVNQEVSAINMNMDEALSNLEDRYVPQARSRQQYAMTSINNLALMLSETLSQMQQESQNKKPGTGSCNKPGAGKGKKPSLSQLKKMQQELGENMKKMKEKMEKEGNKPGENKKPGQNGMSNSEELAKMAAQQEYLRNMAHQIDMDENKAGGKKLGDLDQIQKEMEENENDIVNKMITEQTMKRLQDIETRLLESERAERERDQDQERKSEEAKNYQKRNPPAFDEYKQLKLKEMELLQTVPPSLSDYYKKKVNDYFQAIEK